MNNKEYLKKLQADYKNAYNHMLDAAKPARDEGRPMNAEESEAFDKFETDSKKFEADIQRVKNMIEAEKRQSIEDSVDIEKPLKKELPSDPKELDKIYQRAFWLKMAKRGEEMTDVERKTFNQINKAHSTTDAKGGYTIPTGFSNQLEVAMKYYGPMLEAGMVFDPGTGGNDYEWPTLNDTSNTGALLNEAGDSSSTVTDLAFSQTIFKAYKFTSKLFAYSAEIDQDSAFTFENILADALGERLGRVINTYLTTGTGSSQPQGVVTGTGTAAVIASGNLATEITRSNLIDLIHAVDRSYRSGEKVGFMFHDSTLAAFKKLALGSGDARPLWVPSMREGEPGTLEGYRYWINNDVAEGAASAKSVLFGNFDKFKIRRAGGVRMRTSEDIYIATDSSAIVAFARLDSKLLDASGGAIKHMRQLSS